MFGCLTTDPLPFALPFLQNTALACRLLSNYFFCSNHSPVQHHPDGSVRLVRIGVVLRVVFSFLYFHLHSAQSASRHDNVVHCIICIRLLRCAPMRGGCFYFVCTLVDVPYVCTYVVVLGSGMKRDSCFPLLTLFQALEDPRPSTLKGRTPNP